MSIMIVNAYNGLSGYRALAAVAVATGMAVRGLRKHSLDTSGAVAAAAVGFLSLGSGVRFGLTLILFYLSSSALTRIGNAKKESIESGHKHGGQRDWIQVLVNSGVAVCLSVGFLTTFGED